MVGTGDEQQVILIMLIARGLSAFMHNVFGSRPIVTVC